jgi:hypothetical protein
VYRDGSDCSVGRRRRRCRHVEEWEGVRVLTWYPGPSALQSVFSGDDNRQRADKEASASFFAEYCRNATVQSTKAMPMIAA